MLHSLFAIVLSVLATDQFCHSQAECMFPRVHYTADTVYVIAGQSNPLVLRAVSSEVLPASPCHIESDPIGWSLPADSDGEIVAERTIRRPTKPPVPKYYTGPTL